MDQKQQEQLSKEVLLEMLRYYYYKVDNNLCMSDEIESATRVLQGDMSIHGTIDDFAKFYGKSKDAVNGIIKRKMIQKPRRNVVLYPFHVFRRLVPDSWKKG